MARYIKSGSVSTVPEINSELEKIATAQTEFLSRSGEAPNEMLNTLDMNNNRITNLPAPTNGNDAARFADVGGGSFTVSIDEALVFDNILEMTTADLAIGQYVRCKRYYADGDLVDGLEYEIQPSATVDGYLDHALSNGNSAVLIKNNPIFLEAGGVVSGSTAGIQDIINKDNYSFYGESEYSVDGVNISSAKNIILKSITTTTADTSAFNIVDNTTPSEKVENVRIQGVTFSGASGVTDNFADISTHNSSKPIIENIITDGGRTTVRLGVNGSVGGANTTDAVLNNIISFGCSSFGVEHIESDRTLLSNLNVGNNGVRIGSHGIRYAGTDKGTCGNVAHGINIRDRLTSGISIQEGASHNVHGLGFIENVGESGIQANTLSTIDAKSIIPALIVKDPLSDGLNLSNLSHVTFDALVDNCGQKGVRIGGGVDPASEGANMGRLLVVDAGNGGAVVASNHNMVDIIVDSSASASAILVSGNENIIRVISRLSATLTVYVTGNKNHVTMIEDGNSAVGLRVDGDLNVIDGIVTGQSSIAGDNNYINAITIGGVTDTGLGNTKPSRTAL